MASLFENMFRELNCSKSVRYFAHTLSLKLGKAFGIDLDLLNKYLW